MSAEPTTTVAATMSALGKHATAIDHIAIAVHDLEESIGLYTRVLGFELVERRKTEGKTTAMVSAVLKAGPITIVLLQGTTPESQVSKYVEHYGPGVQHLAIAVENLPELAEELKAEGLKFDTTVITSPGLRQIFSHRDPGSGMMFELIERLGGDFSDQSVQQLFQQLEAKDSY
ncbi:MAG TPA: VOC family protein [Thermoanaerobaculia bacterium]|nr:VOC family protein [Thermoanaerobaculia bacterium]